MKVLTISGISILVAIIYCWNVFAQEPEQTSAPKLKPAMQRKLDHSKMILEGLATEDYDKIGRSAQALSLISLESGWNVLTTEEYLEQSADFRRILERLRTSAREKNIDRAAMSYLNLTISCVECHKYLRGNKPAIDRVRS